MSRNTSHGFTTLELIIVGMAIVIIGLVIYFMQTS